MFPSGLVSCQLDMLNAQKRSCKSFMAAPFSAVYFFFSYEPVSHTFHVLAKSCRISMISPTVGVLWYTGNLPTKEGGQCTAVPGTPMTCESFVLACFNPLPPRGEGEKQISLRASVSEPHEEKLCKLSSMYHRCKTMFFADGHTASNAPDLF